MESSGDSEIAAIQESRAAIRCNLITNRSSFSIAALLLAACQAEPEPAADPVEVNSEAVVAGHCETRAFEGSGFTACRYDARAHAIELALDDVQGPMRSFDRLEAKLGPRRDELLFAMNAGMYDDAGEPIGLYVEEGRERHRINRNDGPGNFHMKPNGLLAVSADGSVSVVGSDDWDEERARDARWATQSGPMLVINGRLHPRFDPNGTSLHLRNGVGVADRNTAWFAISEEPVSFGRFARLFRDALHCPNALFLDGNVSSLWDPAAGRRDQGYPLGPMVAVFPKSPARP